MEGEKQLCGGLDVVSRLIIGGVLILSLLGNASSGNVAETIWMILRISGIIAIVIAWVSIGYGSISCRARYDWLLLLITLPLSLLLIGTYLSIAKVDGFSVEALRYFIFSTIVHLLLLLSTSIRPTSRD